jgi:hypothetical protein
MQNLTWSAKEKQVARSVFERTALQEERELLEYFKSKSAKLENMEGLRALQYEMQEAERKHQQKYDFRYSQLIIVFGRLVREGRIETEALKGLSEEKVEYIDRIASL